MESRYIEGVSLLPFDSRLSEFIDGHEIDCGGKDMVIGIENLEGEVYRIISTTGMGEYMAAVSFLADLGLEDTLANSLLGSGGFDSRFFVPDQLREEMENSYDRTAPRSGDPLAEIAAAEEDFYPLTATERESVVMSRLGQGLFRSQLIEYWGECAVTGCSLVQILRASHIKPWRSSNNTQRLDMYNGLLLVPNLDATFDAGLITFDENGRVVVSRRISQQVAYMLHLGGKLRINKNKLTAEHKNYLTYHREEVYQDT